QYRLKRYTTMSDQQYAFDEEDAIKFIRQELTKDENEKYDDDEILFIIDIIWDYYERNGFLSLNADITDDEELNIDNLVKYVKNEIKKDGEIIMDPNDIEKIIKAELDYEESIEDFI
ncbi:MAG: hypothetical protein K2L68_04560, partial [Muribaculaceae bacterium]|nr:hypothetical protein [Muribaculaceae bacterium]